MLCYFLGILEPVSIKMAKEQNLSLNPTKILGICGRLMCCLKFESDSYREAKNELLMIGATVSYQGRKGRVIEQDLLRETLIIAFSDEEKVEAALGEVEF